MHNASVSPDPSCINAIDAGTTVGDDREGQPASDRNSQPSIAYGTLRE